MDDKTDDIFGNEEKSRWQKYIDQIPFLGEWIAPKDKVAVVRMAGVIADSSVMRRAGINYHKFREALADAFELPRVRAVALIINSPGGAPAQCEVIGKAIRRLSEKKNVPVFAFVEDVAASGGYWLACVAEEIYAMETSIVGSIGVITSGFGLDDFIRKHDVKRRVYASGRDKSFLDPFQPEKADDLERLRDLQVKMHQSFKDWVHERRGAKLNGDDSELMEGAFWTGTDALERGLIDGIGDIGTIMKEKYGEDVRFIDCSPEKKSLLSSILPQLGESAIDPGAIIDAAEERSAWNRFGL
jgi:signal peptide peptidase SppA